MDHLVDKELVGWSHSKSCSQQLDVQGDTSEELCSSGVSISLAFNIFVSDMDSGIEYTSSKLTNDTKLCSAVDTLEGRDGI